MTSHTIKLDVPPDKSVTLDNLPFAAGESIEIVVRPLRKHRGKDRYPLRGPAVRYESPIDPVAERDWEATA